MTTQMHLGRFSTVTPSIKTNKNADFCPQKYKTVSFKGKHWMKFVVDKAYFHAFAKTFVTDGNKSFVDFPF